MYVSLDGPVQAYPARTEWVLAGNMKERSKTYYAVCSGPTFQLEAYEEREKIAFLEAKDSNEATEPHPYSVVQSRDEVNTICGSMQARRDKAARNIIGRAKEVAKTLGTSNGFRERSQILVHLCQRLILQNSSIMAPAWFAPFGVLNDLHAADMVARSPGSSKRSSAGSNE